MTGPKPDEARHPGRTPGTDMYPQRIAVIGAGISGAAAAWMLARCHDVTLFEAADRLGGHANTVDVPSAGGPVPVDTGFIVCNDVNYPHFTALLAHLGIGTQPSEMSFSVSLGDGAYEYSGSGPGGLFAQRRNLLRPGHWRMLGEISRFYAQARRMAGNGELGDMTLEELLVHCACSPWMRHRHVLPMTAAIWSAPVERILNFPAESFVRFFDNHGLFRLADRPRWRTVTGGSRSYVRGLNGAFAGHTRLSTPVACVKRTNNGVQVTSEGGAAEHFDAAVIATHADEALAMLADPVPAERALLSAFSYESNHAVLHRDPSFMPRRRRCWASWNYLEGRSGGGDGKLHVTYWMNRLQGLPGADNLFLTLNPQSPPAGLLYETRYRHPQYSADALAAQRRLVTLQGAGGLWYCGAHFGDGFHEDGLASAVAVARAFGIAPPWADAASSLRDRQEAA